MLDPEEFELETGAGRRHAGARLRAGAGLRRRRGRHAHLRDRRAPPAPPAGRRRRAPAYVSAFYLPQFHPMRRERRLVGQGLHRMGRRHPGAAQLRRPRAAVPAGRSRLLRPARARGDGRAVAPRRHGRDRRLLRLSLLVRRPPAARGAARRPARRSREVPFRFYLCWANEAWRRNWDGLSGDILMTQSYGEGFEAGARRLRPCPISPTPATPGPTAAGRASSSTARPTCPTRGQRRAAARRLGRGRPPGGRARRRALPRRGREPGGARTLRLLGRDAAARPRRPEGLSGRRPGDRRRRASARTRSSAAWSTTTRR